MSEASSPYQPGAGVPFCTGIFSVAEIYCASPVYLHLLKYALGVVAGQSSPDPAPLRVAYTPSSVPTKEPVPPLSSSADAVPKATLALSSPAGIAANVYSFGVAMWISSLSGLPTHLSGTGLVLITPEALNRKLSCSPTKATPSWIFAACVKNAVMPASWPSARGVKSKSTLKRNRLCVCRRLTNEMALAPASVLPSNPSRRFYPSTTYSPLFARLNAP